MMDVFRWVEQTPLSVYMREDLYAYFVVLIFHAWGMAFLVGGGMAISLRVMGIASSARLDRFAGFFPFMKAGAAMTILSGLLLLAGYPAKALTNWVFAAKFICLGSAAFLVWRMARDYFPLGARGEALPRNARWVAATCFLLWVGGVTGGKMLLHTYKILLVTQP